MPNYFFPTELSPVKSNNREIWAMLQTLIWSTYEQVFAHSDINVLASLRLPRPAFYTKQHENKVPTHLSNLWNTIPVQNKIITICI